MVEYFQKERTMSAMITEVKASLTSAATSKNAAERCVTLVLTLKIPLVVLQDQPIL